MDDDTATIAALQAEIQQLQAENDRLRQHIATLEHERTRVAPPPDSPQPDATTAFCAYPLRMNQQLHLERLLIQKAALIHLVMTISNRFITISTDEVEAEIRHTLQMIGTFTQVDAVLATLFNDDTSAVSLLCAWYADENTSVISGSNPNPMMFSWVLDHYKRGRTIAISRIDDLPPAARTERDYCRQQGIRSFLGVPMFYKGVPIGEIVCVAMHHEHTWLPDIIDLVTFIGEIITGALKRKQAEDALRASERHFRAIFDYTPMGIAFSTVEGQVTQSNAALQRFLGYTSDELCQMTYIDITHGDDLEEELARGYDIMESGTGSFEMEKRYIRKDGTIVWGHLTATFVTSGSDATTFCIGMVENITRRKQAEAALRESEERFRTLVEAAPVAIFMHHGTQVSYANAAAEAITGYSRQEFQSLNVWTLVHPECQPMMRERFERFLAGIPSTPRYELKIITRDGTERWLDSCITTIEYAHQSPLVTIAMDITERKRAEAALEQSQSQLRDLTQQITRIQEDERGRLSRELHDESSQALIAILMSLRFIQTHLPNTDANARHLLTDAIQLTEATMERLKSLAYALRPPALDTLGLNDALTELSMAFARSSGLAVDMISAPIPELSDEIGICLYRFVQEALTNIVKHAHAHHVLVELASDAETISVTVADDGQGMSSLIANEFATSGMGLLGMRERLRFLDGSLEVFSRDGRGMGVRATIPLSEEL